jgi:hypothetical protein
MSAIVVGDADGALSVGCFVDVVGGGSDEWNGKAVVSVERRRPW